MSDLNASKTSSLREDWDVYWAGHRHVRTERSLYDLGAKFYRKHLIEPLLTTVLKREFREGARLLHAGCGSGAVDKNVAEVFRITAVDISPNAVEIYRALNPGVDVKVADIFDLSAVEQEFDGVYNLGVMEHFSPEEIVKILSQLRRVLKDGGKLVLLWPPVYGLSVVALHAIHFLLNTLLRRNIQLHPPEPTKVSSRRQISSYLTAAGFRLSSMEFGPRDAFTYVVVCAEKC